MVSTVLVTGAQTQPAEDLSLSQACALTWVILTLGSQRQKKLGSFEASQGYKVRPPLSKNKTVAGEIARS